MKQEFELAQLLQVDRHIVTSRRLIRQQIRVIRQLAVSNHHTRQAKELLGTLLDAQAALRLHRRAILDELRLNGQITRSSSDKSEV